MASTSIGTHSGTFHVDEAFACFLLRATPTYKGAAIVRSRDPDVLKALPIIVDVGGTYDPATHRYDHHQKGFTETFSPAHTTKLSSAGLVYKHFGKDIVASLTNETNEATLELLYQRMYTKFVEGLDGVDNGVSRYPSDATAAYEINTALAQRVSRLNPAWNEQSDDADMLVRFERAVAMAGEDFMSILNQMYKSWLPARDVVVAAVDSRKDVHASGRIIKLAQATAWASHLCQIEQERAFIEDQLVFYVLYQDQAQKWRVQAVAESPGSFVSRKALPEPWRGVRDAALSELSGIEKCIFVHAGGFIGGAETYEGALAMAVAGVEWDDAQAAKKRKV